MGLDTLSMLSGIGSAASAVASPASAASSVASALTGSGTGSTKLTQAVMIGLGLLFIAAGIFSFDKTREILVAGGKTAVKAAAA